MAYGAALQAGVLTGSVRDTLLLDVTASSLGIAVGGGATHKLIERGTTIPTKRSEMLTLARDTDAAATVHIPVVRGESETAADNERLGVLRLTGLTSPAKGGPPDIEVMLEIDANALLRASATDLATGTTWSMNIDGVCAVERTRVRQESARTPVPRPRPLPEQPPAQEQRTSGTPKRFRLPSLAALLRRSW
ncbi:Hsp70 family protein [Streptomyces phaeolivaceus]|uniref:Hsp70 family protein n=1 Tax=Streptomyces phaeolivaceus TaxID=2653200 RepID=A0A5P8K1F7_9ACTN|nr:Hsp70 family protein [Streptomyces phaeolivaceus]QFQ96876.1 Hsp70 family protein [Streptomyces phaeolivaceus]